MSIAPRRCGPSTGSGGGLPTAALDRARVNGPQEETTPSGPAHPPSRCGPPGGRAAHERRVDSGLRGGDRVRVAVGPAPEVDRRDVAHRQPQHGGNDQRHRLGLVLPLRLRLLARPLWPQRRYELAERVHVLVDLTTASSPSQRQQRQLTSSPTCSPEPRQQTDSTTSAASTGGLPAAPSPGRHFGQCAAAAASAARRRRAGDRSDAQKPCSWGYRARGTRPFRCNRYRSR